MKYTVQNEVNIKQIWESTIVNIPSFQQAVAANVLYQLPEANTNIKYLDFQKPKASETGARNLP